MIESLLWLLLTIAFFILVIGLTILVTSDFSKDRELIKIAREHGFNTNNPCKAAFYIEKNNILDREHELHGHIIGYTCDWG